MGKSPVRFGGFSGLGVYRNGAPVHATVGVDLEGLERMKWAGGSKLFSFYGWMVARVYVLSLGAKTRLL